MARRKALLRFASPESLTLLAWLLFAGGATAGDVPALVRSAGSGAWSAASTWEGGAVPTDGARVQIRTGHVVEYDASSDRVIRSIHVAGTLRFATDRTTRLDVGLIKVQAGDDASEDGFDCDDHAPTIADDEPRPSLVVGTEDRPIPAEHAALIRLVAVDGLDPDTCPAIVCCGGRMEFHGAPMPRTWVKLGRDARPGDTGIELAEPVPGWRAGDHLLVTATRRDRTEGKTLRAGTNSVPTYTEERTLRTIDGPRLTIDRPLGEPHRGSGDLRGEVANLSRNVVVESADPSRARGHTMYHYGSTGSIGYAEFRHLGREGVKGRYPIHFHLVRDSMRGSSVVGASIWDSGNRWVTVHGTNYLVVRDCVGYRAVGHGFFLEDGTETLNAFDRNLAVQAFAGRPLPDQALSFDDNSGAGFWWANSLNSFTRNVAVECDRYGFRYEATPTPGDDLQKRVLLTNGFRERRDVRTLPFLRFAGNEAHAQLYGIDLGEGTEGVGPDRDHSFVLRDTRIWDALWAFRPEVPNLLVAGMTIDGAQYGLFHAVGDHQVYRGLTIRRTFVAGSATEAEPGDELTAPDANPPTTIITFVGLTMNGERIVRGTTIDDGAIRRVVVNGCDAAATTPDFAEWEARIPEPPDGHVTARSEDAAGHVEARPHRMTLNPQT